MDDAINTIEYKGYTIGIYPDQCNGPREWDNLCEFHCWHRRMNLGDENYNPDTVDGERKLKDVLKQAKKNNDIILPLYIYQHSGVALSLDNTTYPFNDQWDAGQVGYIIIRRKEALKEWGYKIMSPKFRQKLIKQAHGEVQTYNQFLCGDVYGYQITNKDGEDVESCWGYYGQESAETEAKSIVDHCVEQNKKEHQKKLKAQIKHGTPLNKREPLKT
jgi:hypothetical protein